MGFVFVDSFDHYTSLPGKWDSYVGCSIGAYGRYSTNGLRCSSHTSWVSKTIPQSATHYIGFAIKLALNWNAMRQLVAIADESTMQVGIVIDTSGRIVVCRQCYYTYPLSDYIALTTDVWHHLEMKFVIGDAGSATVKLNGVTVIDVSGVDTQQGSNSYGQRLVMFPTQGSGFGLNLDIDDLWVATDAYYGDCRVIYCNPSGAGNYTQFDPSTGANYECVNEAVPDTNDYVSTTVADEIDSYAMTDISQSAGTVKAVVGNYYCQKTDAGSRQLDMLTRLSSTDLLTGSPKGVPSSWGYLQFIQETKPGGGAWSVQNTKDAEMGMKLEV